MTHRTPRMNQLMGQRLIDAANALDKLNTLHVEVLHIDLSNAIPLLKVRGNKALNNDNNTWTRARRNEAGQRINVKRSNIARCFVEWEVQP